MAGALGLMALGGIGQWGFNQIQGARDRDRREEFRNDMQTMLGGIDMTTPEGFAKGAQAMLFDPRTLAMGGNMLDASLGRRQNQENIEWGRNNLTKAQQEDLNITQQRLANDAAEAQQRIAQGWAGVDINRQQLGLQQQQAERAAQMSQLQQEGLGLENQIKQAQLAGVGMPDPAKVQAQVNNLRDMTWKNLEPFRQTAAQYNQTMGIINNPNPSPLDLQAGIVSFVKAFDPNSVVSGREGETIAEGASGFAGQLAQQLKAAKGGGMTDQTRYALSSTLNAMMKQREAEAAAVRDYVAANAQANPLTQMPAIPVDPFFAGIDLNPTAKWEKQAPARPAINKDGEVSEASLEAMRDQVRRNAQRR